MYCPNCGNKTSADQKFCRSCGLALEKVASALSEQLPNSLSENLHEKAERLEKLGVAALSVFGLTILGFTAYGIFFKLMITQGKIIAGLVTLGTIFVIGCALLSVILFAKANEIKAASSKRRLEEQTKLDGSIDTTELLAEAGEQPMFSVADRTTELLFAETKKTSEKK